MTSSESSSFSSFSMPNASDSCNGQVSDAVGLSDPELGQSRRRIMDLVNRLHNTGVQADIDLPVIAVIGIQSAGKSSLIEAISGITLPRASGTCTRCPTECRLAYSEQPWKCVVSLRFTTDAKGQPLGQAKNVQFGSVITERSDVEDRIRRGQSAILNPSRSPDEFLHETTDELSKSELSFSINCISLQISGPDVTDLSFCDLPGLISSVGSGGSSNDISLVETLVTTYIKQPSCIILLTVACETDFENQGAHRLAKQFDPEGKRTIGVLTKPDRIPTGEEKGWLSFIMNDKEPLQNGWFCVKQPSSADLQKGITWQQARAREDEYFMTSPWSELDSTYQRCLRTSNLVVNLSTVLSDLIAKRLPEIQEELERCIDKTAAELGGLSKEPTDDPMGEIMNLVHNFTMDLKRHNDGVPESNALLQTIRPAQEQFRRAIRETAPDFRPFEKGSESETDSPSGLILDEDDGTYNETSTGSRNGKFVFHIDEVMEKAKRARTRELPGNYPYVVKQEFIKELIKHWRSPAIKFSKSVYDRVLDHMRKLIHDHFSSYGQGVLEQRVKILMQNHLKRCLERSEEHITWLLELEETPSTLNHHYFFDYRDKFFANYKCARAKNYHPNFLQHVSKPSLQPSTSKVIQGLHELGITNVKPEDLPKLIPSDPMEPALLIMAEVRAYFQVAYKRFADNVPNAVDVTLVRGTEKDMLSMICTGLGIRGKNGFEACKEFAKEHPMISSKRADLKKKLERLNVAADELVSMSR